MLKRVSIILLLLLAISPALQAQDDSCEESSDEITADNVAAMVAAEMEHINRTYLQIDDADTSINYLEFEEDGLYVEFADGLIFFGVDADSDTFTGEAYILYGTYTDDGFVEEAYYEGSISAEGAGCDFRLAGDMVSDSDGSSVSIDTRLNTILFGAGTSQIEVEGDIAYITGDLGTRTYQQITDLIAEYPEVNTLELVNVPGSVNDEINIHTGRLVREAGLNTYVPANGLIASGGVDLFIAGVERFVEEGAQIGVHSWCCEDDMTAIELPRDHPAHQNQKDYHSAMLGDRGIDFYFYTLEAAAFDDIYYMQIDEIKEWELAEVR
ncbi:MAG: hypothetical protein ACPG7F_04445 [Aggregatilineales bacterium]